MALINCLACAEKISNKAKVCPHCQLDMTKLDTGKISAMKKINKVEKSQQLMNHSFIAMLLFCGGFLFMYYQNANPESWQYKLAFASTTLGFVLYIITRIRLILLKRR